MVLNNQKEKIDEIKQKILDANIESLQKSLEFMKVFIADEIVLISAQNDKFFILSTKGLWNWPELHKWLHIRGRTICPRLGEQPATGCSKVWCNEKRKAEYFKFLQWLIREFLFQDLLNAVRAMQGVMSQIDNDDTNMQWAVATVVLYRTHSYKSYQNKFWESGSANFNVKREERIFVKTHEVEDFVSNIWKYFYKRSNSMYWKKKL